MGRKPFGAVYVEVCHEIVRYGGGIVVGVGIMLHQVLVASEGAGIGHFTPKRLSLTTFSHNPDNPNSLSRNPVNAILEDRFLW